ncbi:MAG TPA: hypothetical protein VK357_00685 [Rubrobacteraceae bacterium]|nr:hypothetical protein [Rubrobacteraceae bacterium]
MTEDVVRAKRFELVDDNEDVRGGMEVNELGIARVFLRLPNGTGGVEMNVEENGTTNFIMKDEQDRIRSRLSYRSLAATAGPLSLGLVFSDGNKDRAQIGLSSMVETPSMILTNQDGAEKVSIAVTETAGAGLTISDEQGKPRAALAIQSDGTPILYLLDEDGRPSYP